MRVSSWVSLSSFMAKKLDVSEDWSYPQNMPKKTRRKPRQSTAETMRERVNRGGARLWKYTDFETLPPAAVAKTFSRLAQEGLLERVAKGVYYHPEQTSFGPSLLGATGAMGGTITAPVHPAGLSAANALGLSTQNPYRTEFATTAPGPPSALREFVVHTGRPAERKGLSVEEGAILEVLRERAKSSDLSPDQTAKRLLRLLADEKRFIRVVRAAAAEPPRVRAMLGALGEELGIPPRLLEQLKRSLNPLSRYDFGRLGSLRHAREWQAK
jgi:hypothetical protein